MPRYRVRAFYLTSDPFVERVQDFIISANDEREATDRARAVDLGDLAQGAYSYEVEEA